jgi:hypothetical protein
MPSLKGCGGVDTGKISFGKRLMGGGRGIP